MAKGDPVVDGKPADGNSPTKTRPKSHKPEPFKEEFKEIPIEKQIKDSSNTFTDKNGVIYSCDFTVSKNDQGKVLFNSYQKKEILNPLLRGLHLYARLHRPRLKMDGEEAKEQRKGITKEAFEAFLEIIKCPVCLEVMDDPVNVKTCLHKFCYK